MFAPLWTNEPGNQGEVLYDRAFDVYLAVYAGTSAGSSAIKIRASKDLIHWSAIADPIVESGHALFYPTLLGETGDPTIAGVAPRLYFSSFPVGAFPDWRTATFESVQLTLSSP